MQKRYKASSNSSQDQPKLLHSKRPGAGGCLSRHIEVTHTTYKGPTRRESKSSVQHWAPEMQGSKGNGINFEYDEWERKAYQIRYD